MKSFLVSLLLVGCAEGIIPTPIPPDQEQPTPICETAVSHALCEGGANHFNKCCGGTFPAYTAATLCQHYDSSNWDPNYFCPLLEQTSCSIIHNALLLAAQCCCPTGQTCDFKHEGVCYTPIRE